jgi:hypothetical protein
MLCRTNVNVARAHFPNENSLIVGSPPLIELVKYSKENLVNDQKIHYIFTLRCKNTPDSPVQ